MKNTYTFVGHDKAVNNKEIFFPVEVTVRGSKNEKEALKVAKKMASRKHYYLKSCWETREEQLNPETKKFFEVVTEFIKRESKSK